MRVYFILFALNNALALAVLDQLALVGADTLVWLTAERQKWMGQRIMDEGWDMNKILEKQERVVDETISR